MTHSIHEKTLWLVGFRINPDNVDPEIYTLMVINDKDRPLVVDGQILLFSKPDLADKALSFAESDVKRLGPAPKEIDLVCDVAQMMHLIESEKIDPSAFILNCLNTLFDLINVSSFTMPAEYKRILYKFADHLTFNKEFESFLIKEDISREAIFNAIFWCIGIVATKAKLLT